MLGRGYTHRVTYDGMSACPVGIDFEHHELHEGHAFQADVVKALTLGNTYLAVFTTQDHPTLRCHIIFDISCTGEYVYELLEGVTGVVGGTPYVARNRKRESSAVSTMTLLDDVTSISGFVTKLENHHRGSTQGAHSSGGGSLGDKEWILAPNTTYAIRMTAIADGVVSIEANWYEHKTQMTD